MKQQFSSCYTHGSWGFSHPHPLRCGQSPLVLMQVTSLLHWPHMTDKYGALVE